MAQLLTIQEVADQLRVSPRHAMVLLKAGNFPNAFKIGTGESSPWRIPISDVDAFMQKNKIQLSQGER